jgi:hypothetical protein
LTAVTCSAKPFSGSSAKWGIAKTRTAVAILLGRS